MTEARTFEQPDQFPGEHSEFLIRGPAGAIECATDVPEPDLEVPATVILCHPHPLHGGTMHNKVVTIMERSMRGDTGEGVAAEIVDSLWPLIAARP